MSSPRTSMNSSGSSESLAGHRLELQRGNCDVDVCADGNHERVVLGLLGERIDHDHAGLEDQPVLGCELGHGGHERTRRTRQVWCRRLPCWCARTAHCAPRAHPDPRVRRSPSHRRGPRCHCTGMSPGHAGTRPTALQECARAAGTRPRCSRTRPSCCSRSRRARCSPACRCGQPGPRTHLRPWTTLLRSCQR